MREINRLESLYATDDDTLKARLAALYAAGLPIIDILRMLHAISPGVDISYSTVRNWIIEGQTLPNLADSMPAPFVSSQWYTRHGKPTRVYVQIPQNEREMFAKLAKRVSGLRGTTAEDDPLWATRDLFEDAIWTYYQRGVRITDIARVAGVTHRAIAHRINRIKAAKTARTTRIPTP